MKSTAVSESPIPTVPWGGRTTKGAIKARGVVYLDLGAAAPERASSLFDRLCFFWFASLFTLNPWAAIFIFLLVALLIIFPPVASTVIKFPISFVAFLDKLVRRTAAVNLTVYPSLQTLTFNPRPQQETSQSRRLLSSLILRIHLHSRAAGLASRLPLEPQ
jgi:hypothetical protein